MAQPVNKPSSVGKPGARLIAAEKQAPSLQETPAAVAASRWPVSSTVWWGCNTLMAIFDAWCGRVPKIVTAGNIADATKRRPGVEFCRSLESDGSRSND